MREVRRRNWSTEDRLRIARETLEPGVIVQALADRHGVSTGQLYTWQKQMLATAMAGFVPVEIVPEAPQLPPPMLADAPPSSALRSMIEITLPSGASIRISGGVDTATLRLVFAEMSGR